MHLKIKKIKLIKSERLEISYSLKRDDKSSADISEARDTEVHPDMKAALQNLAKHIAVLCEFHTPKSIKTDGALKTFIVTGFSKGGGEDEEGVVITGYKLTKAGQSFTLNTPFTKFEQEDAGRYPLLDDLISDIDLVDAEVKEYMNGKKAPEPQLSMFPDNSDDHDEDEAPSNSGHRIPKADPEAMKRVAAMDDEEDDIPETPKKTRGRKKKAQPKKNHLGQELSDFSVSANDEE